MVDYLLDKGFIENKKGDKNEYFNYYNKISLKVNIRTFTIYISDDYSNEDEPLPIICSNEYNIKNFIEIIELTTQIIPTEIDVDLLYSLDFKRRSNNYDQVYIFEKEFKKYNINLVNLPYIDFFSILITINQEFKKKIGVALCEKSNTPLLLTIYEFFRKNDELF